MRVGSAFVLVTLNSDVGEKYNSIRVSELLVDKGDKKRPVWSEKAQSAAFELARGSDTRR